METRTFLLPLGAMARKAHVPPKWLKEQAEAGNVPHLNAGGKLLFNSEIVERLLMSLASAAEHQQACAHA